jgi:apolipoprotein N-acyltransferase
MVAAATPPFDAIGCVWLGLALFAASLDVMPHRSSAANADWKTRAAQPIACGLAFGFAVNVLSLRFVPAVIVRFTPLPWSASLVALAALCVAQAAPWGAAALASHMLRRLGAPSALAFATGIYGATFAPGVFPWTPAGLVAHWSVMVQSAELVGERGIAFLIALTSGLLANAAVALFGARSVSLPARLRRLQVLGPLAASASITLVIAAYGTARMTIIAQVANEPHAQTARIALIDPAVPAEVRWDPARAAEILNTLHALSRDAEAQGVELTVWHETAYPYVIASASRRCPTGDDAILGPGVHGPVLTGMMLSAGPNEAYNAASVCMPGATLSAPYAKRRLLSFGEAVPFARYAPWLRRLFVRGLGLIAGERNEVLSAGRIRASVLICVEDLLTDAGRDAMNGSPNLLVNITNDAWFEGSAESELHLRLSALRAIETRRDFVRAVNIGPLAWLDATGRVRARSLPRETVRDVHRREPHVLVVTPTLRDDRPTLYSRFGDAPMVAGLATAIASCTLVSHRRKRRERSS